MHCLQRYFHQLPSRRRRFSDREWPAHVAAITHVFRPKRELHYLVTLDFPIRRAAETQDRIGTRAYPGRIRSSFCTHLKHGRTCYCLQFPLLLAWFCRIQSSYHSFLRNPVCLDNVRDILLSFDRFHPQDDFVGREKLSAGSRFLQIFQEDVGKNIPVANTYSLRCVTTRPGKNSGKTLATYLRNPVGSRSFHQQGINPDVS